MIKGTIVELLLSTNRVGMDELLRYMDESGFYSAPCSGAYHLAEEGGLAKHSLNVYRTMLDLNQSLKADIPLDTIILVSILHDLGKWEIMANQIMLKTLSEARPRIKRLASMTWLEVLQSHMRLTKNFCM